MHIEREREINKAEKFCLEIMHKRSIRLCFRLLLNTWKFWHRNPNVAEHDGWSGKLYSLEMHFLHKSRKSRQRTTVCTTDIATMGESVRATRERESYGIKMCSLQLLFGLFACACSFICGNCLSFILTRIFHWDQSHSLSLSLVLFPFLSYFMFRATALSWYYRTYIHTFRKLFDLLFKSVK